MGGRVAHLAVEEGHVVMGIEKKDHPYVSKGKLTIKESEIPIYGFPPFPEVSADVGIDFTMAEATLELLPFFLQKKIPLVIGTTGFSEKGLEEIKKAGEKIPILLSPNMSRGVNLLFMLVEILSRALGEECEVEIFEAHHRYKKDAPSGTALKIGEIISKTRGKDLKEIARFSREGITGERRKGEIGFQVLRGGDIVGEHTVFFILDGERVELTHRAMTRDCFARGAIEAAKWLKDKKPGFYTMRDIFTPL